MSKKLVIVESPAKAKTIAGYLGPDFVVESSIGHIRDLPERASEIPKEQRNRFGAMGVAVDHGFEPYYVVDPDKKRVVADLKRKLKDAEAALDAKAYAQYSKLTEDDIKTLVVDDKWLAALDASIHGEMDRISQTLTRRVKELAERYETLLPQMASRVAKLEAKVNRHLERMGFSW